jgi:serine/threonine-protein kinase
VDNLIGKQLGPYRIDALLGEGGMAQVFRARDTKLNRDVALKIIRPNAANSEEFLKRFEREARTVAGLSHPHILKIFDYGQVDGLVYLVMELMTGGSLADQIAKGALRPDQAERWLTHIADALDYAHRQGIVHRDLKPQNVLLDTGGNAFLTDFGIAKIMDGSAFTTSSISMTGAGVVIGTPAYMAPEQWTGDTVDARTDIYALGIMLFEMLTGTVPFSGDTPFRLMYQHVNDRPTPLRMLRADIPYGLQGVIDKALEKVRNNRYASANDMVSAYRAALVSKAAPPPEETTTALPVIAPAAMGEVVKVTAPNAPTGAGNTYVDVLKQTSANAPRPKPANRRGLWLVGGVGIAAAAILGILLLTRPSDSDKSGVNATATAIALVSTIEKSITPLPVASATQLPPTATVSNPTVPNPTAPNPTLPATIVPSLTELPTQSPPSPNPTTSPPTIDTTGTQAVLDAVPKTHAAATLHAIVEATASAKPTLTPTSIPPTPTPLPAATNTLIAATNTPRPTITLVLPTITLVPPSPTVTLVPPTATQTAPLGGGTGQIVFVVENDKASESGIYLANVDGTGKKLIVPEPADDLKVGNVSVSPDGKTVIYIAETKEGRTQIFTSNIDGTNQKQLLKSTYNDYRPVYSRSGTKIAFVRKGDKDNYDIWVMNADGTNSRRLTTDAGFDSEPTWSLDDKIIYYNTTTSGSFQLWQMSSSSGGYKQISFSGNSDVYPDLSPDGRTLVFASDLGGSLQIWQLTLSTGQVKQLTFSSGVSSWPSWSPDGKYILFTTTRNDKKEDVYIMNKDGSNQRPLFATSASEGAGGAKWVNLPK